jgi:hypothetical protein
MAVVTLVDFIRERLTYQKLNGRLNVLKNFINESCVHIDEIATTASPNKLLKLDTNSKLPASITGSASNVTTSINGKPITSIFEADGVTVKKATAPGSHAETHGSTGSDPVTPESIGAATPAEAQNKVDTHETKTTGIHGVGASTIESVAGAQVKANNAEENAKLYTDAHSNKTSGVHGVGASEVESKTGAQQKVNTHANLTTGVHGVGDSTLESTAGAQAKVNELKTQIKEGQVIAQNALYAFNAKAGVTTGSEGGSQSSKDTEISFTPGTVGFHIDQTTNTLNIYAWGSTSDYFKKVSLDLIN